MLRLITKNKKSNYSWLNIKENIYLIFLFKISISCGYYNLAATSYYIKVAAS